MLKTLSDLQDQFLMLKQKMHGKDLIYFDNGATTLKPQCVIEAISQFYSQSYGTVHRAIYQLADTANSLYHQARVAVQQFIGAAATEEVIFTSGTTASINLLAISFAEAFIQKGDEILISEIEHHSNLVPWQMITEKKGACLKFIPVSDEGEIDLDALEHLLSERTKIVAFAHVSNVTGIASPAKQIITRVRARSTAKIFMDGAQAIAHQPIDVVALDVDFYAFSAHKMYGPTGVGILYGRKELLNQMPPVFGGGDMIHQVTLEKTIYNELPLKFEAGTPNIAGVIGLKAAIDFIQNIGFEFIQEHEHALASYLRKKLNSVEGLQIIGNSMKERALVSFHVHNIHALDLATLLDFKGIAVRSGHLCAEPALRRFKVPSFLRASLAIYNTEKEIDLFILALEESLRKLKS